MVLPGRTVYAGVALEYLRSTEQAFNVLLFLALASSRFGFQLSLISLGDLRIVFALGWLPAMEPWMDALSALDKKAVQVLF
jgi:hypothetical protein